MDTGDGPWVLRALDALRECDPRLAVLGARADEVLALLPAGVEAVRNERFERGMGSSLQVGLRALPDVDAALVMLVDLPDVGASVVRRILDAARIPGRSALVRASYAGRPGHPVLLGRDHWAGVIASAVGDEGARGYLRAHPPTLVECGDLATGADVDRPA